MAKLKRIYIITTTANKKDANTDATFDLIASRSGTDWIKKFPNLQHDERECGRTDYYDFNVRGQNISENATLTIRMTSTKDGWLPSSIFAIGKTVNNTYVVLASNPTWKKWFDRGSKAVGPSKHRIN